MQLALLEHEEATCNCNQNDMRRGKIGIPPGWIRALAQAIGCKSRFNRELQVLKSTNPFRLQWIVPCARARARERERDNQFLARDGMCNSRVSPQPSRVTRVAKGIKEGDHRR